MSEVTLSSLRGGVASLIARVPRNVVVSAMTHVANFCPSIIVTPVATRWLADPKTDFGTWTIILVIVGFGTLLSSGGLSSYIVRNSDDDYLDLSSCLLFAVLISVPVSVIVSLAAFFVPGLGKIDGLPSMLIALSLLIPFNAITAVYGGILQREKRFTSLMYVAGIRGLSVILISTYMIVNFHSVWGFVAGHIFATLAAFVLTIRLAWKPLVAVSTSRLKEVARFCRGLIAFNGVNYWSRNLDYVAINSLLGTTALAVYSGAYRLMFAPLSGMTAILNQLALPHLVPLAGSPERLQIEFIRIATVFATVVVSGMSLLLLFADEIVGIYLGDGWESSAGILKVLAVVAMVQSLTVPLGILFIVAKKTDQLFVVGVMNALLMGGLFFFAAGYSSEAVAWAYLVGTVVMLFPVASMSLNGCGICIRTWGLSISRVMLIPLVAAAIVQFVRVIS